MDTHTASSSLCQYLLVVSLLSVWSNVVYCQGQNSSLQMSGSASGMMNIDSGSGSGDNITSGSGDNITSGSGDNITSGSGDNITSGSGDDSSTVIIPTTTLSIPSSMLDIVTVLKSPSVEIITSTTTATTVSSTTIVPGVGPVTTSIIRPTTSSIPTPTPPSKTELSSTLGIAVGLCAAVLVVLIIVASILCCCYIFNGSTTKVRDVVQIAMVELGDDDKNFVNEDDQIYTHLSSIKFPSFHENELPSYVSSLHADSNTKAEEEYEDVRDLDPVPSHHTSLMSYNLTKNRYTNILCKDQTRVILSSINKSTGSDYINANYIEGYNSEKEYIATQGPLPNTTNDFWRMIWEQNTRIIVMVTNLVENGIVKSHDYWPTRSTLVYGTVCVTLRSAKLYPEFVVRTFDVTSIQKNKKTTQVTDVRQVIQYHFTAWPDFGVPHDASSMLKFVRRVRSSVNPAHGPIVTHCSAGVGRTGTFITVDVMLQRMSAGEEISVKEFVCRMRAQRAVMVQTSSQYLFIYDALLHAFIHGTTEVPDDKLKDHVTCLEHSLSVNGIETTRLDKEFKHIMSVVLPSDHLYSVAMETENERKNRSINNLPLDHNRVLLREVDEDDSQSETAGGGGGGEYINASYINGYYNRVEFIATQHPLPTTRGDLWRMVVEREASTVVVVGSLEDDYDCYWPLQGMHEYDGNVTVEIMETEELEDVGMTIRTFNVIDKENDKLVEVEQYHLHSWPNEGAPPTSQPVLELIQRSRQRWKETGFNPIVIHTASGMTCEASGVYCALCVLLRQLEVEESVDVVTVCQRMRRSRPSLLTSKDYYKFIYQVLVASID